MVSTLAAAELLEWRRKQLKAGGEASQLDWLLDLEAVSYTHLTLPTILRV